MQGERDPLLPRQGSSVPKRTHGSVDADESRDSARSQTAGSAWDGSFTMPRRWSSDDAREFLEKARRWDCIVEADTFIDYPGALFWARLVRVLLVLIILGTITVILVYYCLGVVQIDREYYWFRKIPAPTLVICPDMVHEMNGFLSSGQFSDFNITGVHKGRYPSALSISDAVNHTEYDCMDQVNVHCKCIDFNGESFEKHDDGVDLVNIRFNASSDSSTYLFGFNEPGDGDLRAVPQTFGFGTLNTRVLGYLTLHLMDQRSKKAQSFLSVERTKVRDVRLYDWEIAGNAVPSDTNTTEILFGFKTFQVERDQVFSAIFSPFAIATVVVVCITWLNNLNIYQLLFPVQENSIFTQREPASFVRSIFCCCPCLRRSYVNDRPATRLEELFQEFKQQQMCDVAEALKSMEDQSPKASIRKAETFKQAQSQSSAGKTKEPA